MSMQQAMYVKNIVDRALIALRLEDHKDQDIIDAAKQVIAHKEPLATMMNTVIALRNAKLSDEEIMECIEVEMGRRQWDTDVGR